MHPMCLEVSADPAKRANRAEREEPPTTCRTCKHNARDKRRFERAMIFKLRAHFRAQNRKMIWLENKVAQA